MTESLTEAALKVATVCGLSHATVMDLLKQGWTYIDTMGQAPRWERQF